MSYKTISTTYPTGYTLTASSPYGGVVVTSAGYVAGYGLSLLKAGVVDNHGSINGVSVTVGGTVNNAARIYGYSQALYVQHHGPDGVDLSDAGGRVGNTGAIRGGDGHSGTFDGYENGYVGGDGGAGVSAAAGSIVNRGSINGGGGGGGGVYVSQFRTHGPTPSEGFVGGTGGAGVALGVASLTNLGEIAGGAGGYGPNVIYGNGGPGGAGGAGVSLDGGTVTNTGAIRDGGGGSGGTGTSYYYYYSGRGGYYVGGGAGAAGSAGDGVLSTGGGAVVNRAGGTLSGLDGVADSGSGHLTVTNFGAISGSQDSIRFAAASDQLIAEAGAAFTGGIVGGGGTLDLAGGSGAITGLGGTGVLTGSVTGDFNGFGVYALTKDGDWTLQGGGSLGVSQILEIGGGATLDDPGGALALDGIVRVAGILSVTPHLATIAGSGRVVVSGAGVVKLGGDMSCEVVFAAGSTGRLSIGAGADFTGSVAGLSARAGVDLRGVAYNPADTISVSRGVLTISYNAQALASLKLAGHYSAAGLTLSNDGQGGVLITDSPAAASLSQAISAFGPTSSSQGAVGLAAYRPPNRPLAVAGA